MARNTFVALAAVAFGLAIGQAPLATRGDARAPASQSPADATGRRIVLRTSAPKSPAVRDVAGEVPAMPLGRRPNVRPDDAVAVRVAGWTPPAVTDASPVGATTSPAPRPTDVSPPVPCGRRLAGVGEPMDDVPRPIDLSRDMWPTFLDDAAGDVASFDGGPCLTVPRANPPVALRRLPDEATLSPRAARPDAETPNAPGADARAGSPAASVRCEPVDWLRDPALAAVSAQADALAERAFSLAEKGALYSARAEFQVALQTIAKALDARRGSTVHTKALTDGTQALREARDFVAGGPPGAAEVDLRAVVARHRTPVCQGEDVGGMPSVVAMQRYCSYAQERLAFACAGAPAASRTFYGLGKTCMAIAERTPTAEPLSGAQAMVLHRTALAIDPRNFRAANELGVLLARFGQLPEARAALLQSVAVTPMPETWHNLAVVHERLGERDLAARARNELQMARRSAAAQGPPNSLAARPFVEWVDPMQFAQYPEMGSTWGMGPAAWPARTAAAVNGATR